MTTILFAVAAGVCSGYAQTVASSASFPLPGRSASDAPYEFRTDKYDGGMSVSLTLNNVERVLIDSVTGKSRISVPGLSSTTFAGLPALPYKAFRIAPEGSGTPQFYSTDIFGNSNALTAIKQENNRYVISLDKQKKGLCVISMQINGEIVSIHKLIKK